MCVGVFPACMSAHAVPTGAKREHQILELQTGIKAWVRFWKSSQGPLAARVLSETGASHHSSPRKKQFLFVKSNGKMSFHAKPKHKSDASLSL